LVNIIGYSAKSSLNNGKAYANPLEGKYIKQKGYVYLYIVKIKESFIKYYCGVFDADGWCSFDYTRSYLRLKLGIAAADNTDRNFKMLKYLKKEFCGLGSFYLQNRKTSTGNSVAQFMLQTARDVNMVIPRMLKHLVIKGKHCKRMFRIWKSLRGKHLTDKQIDRLKKFSKWSRQHSGPVKPKKHTTWAWLAGYIDGDGCFEYRLRDSRTIPSIKLTISAHEKDRQGIDLIQKAFKGNIYPEGRKPWINVYNRNLGVKDSSFAKKFLPKLLRYCIIKHYRIEQILAFHNKYHQQRLTEKNPTG